MLPFALLLAFIEAGARWGPKAPGAAIYTSTSPTEGSSPSTQSPGRGVLGSRKSNPSQFRLATPRSAWWPRSHVAMNFVQDAIRYAALELAVP